MDHLTGKIRTTLKPVTNPKLSYRFKISEQLLKAHEYLLAYKEIYRGETDVVKMNLYSKDVNYIPDWLNSLAIVLESYLDIKIIKTKIMVDNKVMKTNCVIGNRTDAFIAIKYLQYIYNAIILLEKAKRASVKLKNKKTRRKKRRKGERSTLNDARVVSSGFRKELLKEILSTLNDLLDSLKKDNPPIFMRSLARQEKLENYLEQKFPEGWKTVLSNNGY